MIRRTGLNFALSLYQWRGVWGERQTGTLLTRKGYCANLGHQEDESGFVYMRARYYEPTTGRFVSEDPARDGVNWYLYADANPVNKVDASGKESELVYTAYAMGVLFTLAAIAEMFRYQSSRLGYALESPVQIKRLSSVCALANAAIAFFGIAAVGMLDNTTWAFITAGIIAAAATIGVFVKSTEEAMRKFAGFNLSVAFAYGLILIGYDLSIGAEL